MTISATLKMIAWSNSRRSSPVSFLKMCIRDRQQGCDLSKYAGKRCKRYTYVIENYPGQAEGVRANILVYKNKVIGGDVCSVELDGFMHGFAQRTD